MMKTTQTALAYESAHESAYGSAENMVREPSSGKGLYVIRGGLDDSPAKRRIYVDTSVIGGCLDAPFREGSVALMNMFRAGAATMVVSNVTRDELAKAPQSVRDVLDTMPAEHKEEVLETGESISLAEAYLVNGVLSEKHESDAQHIAVATTVRVDALVSWNFKHIVNSDRIRRYNALNLARGYPILEIHTPTNEVQNHAIRRS